MARLDPSLNDGMIRTLHIDRLREDPDNVKRHPDNQVDQIVASIERFGFNDPIVIDQYDVIAEGHGRYLAAKKLGISEVPVIIQHFASTKERRAYAIAHNQTQHLTPMDSQAVLTEFSELGVVMQDYPSVGYTPEDIAFLAFERRDVPQGGEHGAGDGEGHVGQSARVASALVLRSLLKFDTQEQLVSYYEWLDWLRGRYPMEVTIGDRVMAFVREYGDEPNE